MADAGLSGVLVLVYLDDVLVVGRGRARVREQTAKATEALRRAGAVVSPKSTLEPVQRLVWLGKDIDLKGGEVRTAGNAWEALFAHWLRLSVGPCRVKRLQQFLGRAQWICRPGSGHSPHLSGVWAHVLWAPPRLPFTPVRLLKSMCVACVMARQQWSVVSLPRVVKRSPLVIYVNASSGEGHHRPLPPGHHTRHAHRLKQTHRGKWQPGGRPEHMSPHTRQMRTVPRTRATDPLRPPQELPQPFDPTGPHRQPQPMRKQSLPRVASSSHFPPLQINVLPQPHQPLHRL